MNIMNLSTARLTRWSFVFALLALVPSTGCLHLILATGIYLWDGGNMAPAECELLEKQRVVVFCRQPASQEFRHSGAARQISRNVSYLLQSNVPGIDVVQQKYVDNWIDENDSEDFEELGRAVKADLVVYVDMAHFELFKGKTVYQGNTSIRLSVHDMSDDAREVWIKEVGEVLYPVHSGIAVQDKSKSKFQQEFVGVVSDEIGRHFYKHDPHANFAIDALANN